MFDPTESEFDAFPPVVKRKVRQPSSIKVFICSPVLLSSPLSPVTRFSVSPTVQRPGPAGSGVKGQLPVRVPVSDGGRGIDDHPLIHAFSCTWTRISSNGGYFRLTNLVSNSASPPLSDCDWPKAVRRPTPIIPISAGHARHCHPTPSTAVSGRPAITRLDGRSGP